MKHWPRYSDAVREAGHTPNALSSAFGVPTLIEKLIALIRELKRFPTDSDLRYKKNTDAAFPSASLFWRHLGAKEQQLKYLADYCGPKPGYEDVLAICGKSSAPRRKAPMEESPEASNVAGSVYLLKAGRYFKIGRTNSVGRRGRELAIQLPNKSEIVHEMQTDDPSGIETYWHRRFASKRQNGEWFLLEPEDIRAFKRRLFM